MSEMENSICGKCWQSQCEMRGTPMSWEQINYKNGLELGDIPPKYVYCFYFVCDVGERKAEQSLNEATKFGLIPFGSEDKPHHNEDRPHMITGRFVVNGYTGDNLKHGDIIVRKNDQVFKLTNLYDYEESKKRKMMKSFRSRSSES